MRAAWGRREAVALAVALAVIGLAGVAPRAAFAQAVHIDPVARLAERVAAGDVVIDFDEEYGFLPAFLRELDIPVSSQGLIFSRTSLQTDLVAPWTPRAVYFNDNVYVGWIPETGFMEVASIDPDEGAYFYTVNQIGGAPPVFRREEGTCLICHESRAVTMGVPGVMVRSVLVDRLGYTVSSVHEGSTTDRTPHEQRLGGWYVTGTHGARGHAGNTMSRELSQNISDVGRFMGQFDMTADGNVTDLDGRFDGSPYLSRHSDIVAISVLIHQTRAHNMITLAQQDAAAALKEQEGRVLSEGVVVPESGLLPLTDRRIEGIVDRLIREMMFSKEATWPGPMQGTSTFAADFEARGPFDARGRSLREFDLERRLFRYPLSFLIYSESFDALPELIQDRFYRRLDAVLAGTDESGDFAHLSAADRTAIREILEETKPEYASAIR